MDKLETTLLLLRKEDQILLAQKKRGFGVGKFNGVGGKIKPDETREEAMEREAKEEIGVIPINYHYVGFINFIEFINGKKTNLIIYLYTANEWLGEIIETEEMKPCWFNINEIPFEEMFSDDKYWMPYFLAGEDFDACFEFDEEWNVLSKKITKRHK